MANVKPLEVKKLENGTMAVRWSNSPKQWVIIEDETLIQYIIYRMATG